MKLYFAHPISSYGTPQERRLVDFLTAVGHEVINPNAPEHQAHAARIRAASSDPKNAGREVMAYFIALARRCDMCAVLPFPDGKIGAGIVAEAASFLERGAGVYEVGDKDGGFQVCAMRGLDPKRCLNVEETRKYLRRLSSTYAKKNPGPCATF